MHVHYRTRDHFKPTGGHPLVLRDIGLSESQNFTNTMVSAPNVHIVGRHGPPNVTHAMLFALGKGHLARPNAFQLNENHLDAHTHWFRHILPHALSWIHASKPPNATYAMVWRLRNATQSPL